MPSISTTATLRPAKRVNTPAKSPPDQLPELSDGDGRQEIFAFLTGGPAHFQNQASMGHIEDLVERSGKNIKLRCYCGSEIPDDIYADLKISQLPAVVFRRGDKEVARLERPKNNATISAVDLCIAEFFS